MQESFEIGLEEGVIKGIRLMLVELAKGGFHGEAIEAAAMSTLNQFYSSVMPNRSVHEAADQLREIMREINELMNSNG